MRSMSCAQRLSASRIISVAADGSERAHHLMCSTPFGITDYIGWCRNDPPIFPTLKCSTPFGITDYIGSAGAGQRPTPRSSAQRLSASRIISAPAVVPDRRLRPACAQRLSASRIISGPTDGRGTAPTRGAMVLNAFRHHGLYRATGGTCMVGDRHQCSTPFGITDYIGFHRAVQEPPLTKVLNAFRHHGLYRTVRRQPPPRSVQVLNAFRHHGLYRRSAGAHTPTVECAQRLSASRIISVGRTSPSAACCANCAQRLSASRIISGVPSVISTDVTSSCAQRLSASRIISVAVRGRVRDARRVLNAFRHHGLYRLSTRSAAVAATNSAQRLSASRIISVLASLLLVKGCLTVCSTPFGITDYIGVGAGPPFIDAYLCSTPFGITDYIGLPRQRDGARGRVMCSTPFGITDYIGGYRRRTA